MLKQHIVVIGGYGHVGGHICRMLGETYPGLVYAAGRNLDRAQRFCRETGGKVKPMHFNRDDAADWDWLEQTKLVIVCIDQVDTVLAETCLANGVNYLDITANGPFLAQLERLNHGHCEGTGLLSVGLAPGLTNLLAQEAAKTLDETSRINITIMLGLGDSHGKAAIEWTVDHLHTVFDVTENGDIKKVSSFTDGRQTDFGGRLGCRTAYRFPFSDQATLPRTLEIPSVSTRLCFDSRLATLAIAGLRKSGAVRLLKNSVIRGWTVKLLESLKIGSAEYAVKVDAEGLKGGRHHAVGFSMYGENESLITARVAFAAASALYAGAFQRGMFHLEELFELERTDDVMYVKRKETGERFVI
ncbi:saccharopine dehydrogenase family protein [Bacillus sp. NSP9.1]|uniref:saccharopine dehydrogenase family protein n=1 Tax=Bacillus sp. NSP9.1 TaxID=1071078 RepID=UPI0003F9AE50|nr:saccharopine dehydrogenase NADP-binding domain-containing protein [Bacillus sp. NSP9.1]QHZ48794.1 saccharopine dehydrogenase [Bacillus sp. NSP9.1]